MELTDKQINELESEIGYRVAKKCSNCMYSKNEVLPLTHCGYNPSIQMEVDPNGYCNNYMNINNSSLR